MQASGFPEAACPHSFLFICLQNYDERTRMCKKNLILSPIIPVIIAKNDHRKIICLNKEAVTKLAGQTGLLLIDYPDQDTGG
jgi:hypothetical protein